MSDVAPVPGTRAPASPRDRAQEFLLTREVAELLRTPESTVRYWRHIRTGPPSLKVGRRVLYRRHAVLAWLSEQESGPREASSPSPEVPDRVGQSALPAPRRWVSR